MNNNALKLRTQPNNKWELLITEDVPCFLHKRLQGRNEVFQLLWSSEF